MNYVFSKQITLLSILFFIFNTNMNAGLPDFVKNLGLKPRDAYIAGGATLASAALLIPSCIMWSNKHHPAALAKRQLEKQMDEQHKKDRIAKEREEENKRLESKKTKARILISEITHNYDAEITLLPNDRLLSEKNEFIRIIKSKCNAHPTPFSHYHQTLTNDLYALRNLANTLETEKDIERRRLINKLEQILRIHNLAIADTQKIEKEVADAKKRSEESEQRKIEKEILELEKYRAEIANIHEAHKINSQIKTELHHVHTQLEALKNRSYDAERTQTIRAEKYALTITELKTTIIALNEEIKKTMSTQTQTTQNTSNNLIKILNELKRCIEKLGFSSASPLPPFNPELLKPATAYSPAPTFNSAAIQPIPVPVAPSAPPL